MNETRSPTQRSAEAVDDLVNGRVINHYVRIADGTGRHEIDWVWSGPGVSERLLPVPRRLPLCETRDPNVSQRRGRQR